MMSKSAFVRVGFEVWYTGPNTPEAIDHLHSSILADMDTWKQWVQIEAVETEDASSGDVPEWLWECIEEDCPCLDEEGHGTSCARCEGREKVVPGWEEPPPRPWQPDREQMLLDLIEAVRDLANSADSTGCTDDLTVVSQQALDRVWDITTDITTDIKRSRKESE